MAEMAETRLEQFQRLYKRGMELLDKGEDDRAMAVMWEAAKAAPEGWLQVAIELIKDGKTDLALERLREVLALTTNTKVRAAALNNLGMILANRGQNTRALEAFELTSREEPGYADTWSNLALVNKWNGRYSDAIRYASKALTLDPWHEQAGFIRSMALLLDCQLERGFAEYECRWRSKSNGLRKIESPVREWDGTHGTRLLVYGEQGHGDSILMLRYAKRIREMGLWQAWVAQKSMVPLLRMIPEIDLVLEPGEPLPEFDCHIPSVSIPRVLGETIETLSGAPYVHSDLREDYGEGFHVGIVWRGSHAQLNDMFRSTCLSDWKPVMDVPGVTFHSLQVDHADEALLYPQIISHPKPEDWSETVRRVQGLDLVITVDTSMVHLCGALGVPCWVAMHCRPYFVYPTKFIHYTPWYDSVSLCRQPRELEWSPVFQEIAEKLTKKCSNNTLESYPPDGETSQPSSAIHTSPAVSPPMETPPWTRCGLR